MSDQGETPDTQPQNTEATIGTEAISKAGAFLGEVLAPLTGLRDTTDKMYAGYLAYIDRVILLAGGTLTLTFTAVATISSHLSELGRDAYHPRYIVVECWLLVATIWFGLAYSRLMIALRQKNDQNILLSQMHLNMVVKMMAVHPQADFKKMPGSDGTASKETERLLKMCRFWSALTHFSLIGAFVCLALFIQGNIVSILTAASHTVKK
jgi:hypothetical protein